MSHTGLWEGQRASGRKALSLTVGKGSMTSLESKYAPEFQTCPPSVLLCFYSEPFPREVPTNCTKSHKLECSLLLFFF